MKPEYRYPIPGIVTIDQIGRVTVSYLWSVRSSIIRVCCCREWGESSDWICHLQSLEICSSHCCCEILQAFEEFNRSVPDESCRISWPCRFWTIQTVVSFRENNLDPQSLRRFFFSAPGPLWRRRIGNCRLVLTVLREFHLSSWGCLRWCFMFYIG